jgi:hypothetical protein
LKIYSKEKNKSKPEILDPRAAKIAELTALLEKAHQPDPRAVKIAELTALLDKADKEPSARDKQIEELERKLSDQDSVIKKFITRKKFADEFAWKAAIDAVGEDDEEEEVTPTASFSPKKQKTNKKTTTPLSTPSTPTPTRRRGRSPTVRSPTAKSPRAKRVIDPEIEPCLNLISDLNTWAQDADTMCTPNDFAHSLAQFDARNLLEFFKHFNIPYNQADTTAKTLLRKKNLEATIAVLQARCLLAME